MNDTSPKVEQIFRQLMLTRSGIERMRMASNMYDAARRIVISSLPAMVSEIEMRDHLCLRFYKGEVDTTSFSRALRSKTRFSDPLA